MESASDNRSDHRFDPNHAAQLLLEIAHEQSLEALLQKLVQRAVERPDFACAQIWLIDKGDLCSTCPHQPECPDRCRCLHLVAGKGRSLSTPGPEVPRFDDFNARIPLGIGFLGKAVTTGQQSLLKDLVQQAGELVGFDWLKPEQIHGITATPIIFKGEVLGVIVVFTRANFPEESRPWGRIFADHIGAAIANARRVALVSECQNESFSRGLSARLPKRIRLRGAAKPCARGYRLSIGGGGLCSWWW